MSKVIQVGFSQRVRMDWLQDTASLSLPEVKEMR